MTALSIAVGLSLTLTSLAQNPATSRAIKDDESSYQSEAYQRWWGQELVWRFDDLPTNAGVPETRIPYSGHDYPDRAGGTIQAMRKYDLAFHRGQALATAFEQKDTTTIKEPTVERRGVLRLRRAIVERTPGWHGHCNGWTAASIRHAEPQTSVQRNGITFTPADIKALLAEIYMYSEAEFLGGDDDENNPQDDAINPGLLHVVLANWIGRNSHPVAMDSTLGKEVWNYPLYAFSTSSAKRSGGREVEVRMNAAYSASSNQEHARSPRLKRIKSFHYVLDLDSDGKVIGGRYLSDSARVDMLWTPLTPAQGGQEGNERGNPHVDVNEVLAIWRESVPEEVRQKWINIDPAEEDSQSAASHEAVDREASVPTADG
jgi:hypothetical protein